MGEISKKLAIVEKESSGFLSTSYNPFWSSSLFNEVYLRNESGPEFEEMLTTRKNEIGHFVEKFTRFAQKRSDVANLKRSEADTIRNSIVPVLKMLNWHNNCDSEIDENPYVEEFSFTVEEEGKSKTYRSDLLLVDFPDHVKFFGRTQSSDERIAAAKNSKTGAIIVVEAKKWDELDFFRNSAVRETADAPSLEEATGQSFEEQVLTYMKHLDLKFGILTDGKV